MAVLSITEYSELATYPTGAFLIGKEPAAARQSVTYTSSVASDAFNASTRFIRVVATADAYLEFGAAPTADANSTRLVQDQVEFIAVEAGSGLKVAAYDGSS